MFYVVKLKLTHLLYTDMTYFNITHTHTTLSHTYIKHYHSRTLIVFLFPMCLHHTGVPTSVKLIDVMRADPRNRFIKR